MKTVAIRDMRKEVKKYIDHAEDKVVKMVYAMLEVNAEEDWWDTMPDEVKEEVTTAIKQADKGEVMTYEQVKKKHPQWLNSLDTESN